MNKILHNENTEIDRRNGIAINLTVATNIFGSGPLKTKQSVLVTPHPTQKKKKI